MDVGGRRKRFISVIENLHPPLNGDCGRVTAERCDPPGPFWECWFHSDGLLHLLVCSQRRKRQSKRDSHRQGDRTEEVRSLTLGHFSVENFHLLERVVLGW